MPASYLINLIERLYREIADLQQKLSRETQKESEKLKRIGQLTSELNRATNLSSASSKMNDISRTQKEIADIQKAKASLSKSMGEKEQQLSKAQSDLVREKQNEQKKIQEAEKRLIQEHRSHQALVSAEIARQTSSNQRQHPVKMLVDTPVTEYDFFISHAWEDKEDLVRDLVRELESRNLRIWYDEHTLKIGDSLRQSIDRGLRDSRFGVVILSPSFFMKGWTNYELNGMVTKEMTGGKVVLPIWHKVSKDEVAKYSQSLADKLALNTAAYSISEIAEQLSQVVED